MYLITKETRYTTEHECIRVPHGNFYNRFEHGTISWQPDDAHVTYPRERLDPAGVSTIRTDPNL